MTAKEKKKTSKRPATRTALYIVGDSPLVEEYARLCSQRGYGVVIHRTSEEGSARRKSDEFRQSAIVPPGTHLALEVSNIDLEAKKKNLQKLDNALPATAAILTSSVTVSASEQATWIHKRHRLVGFSAFPTFSDGPLVEVAPTVHTPPETLEVVQKFFLSIGKECEYIQDRVGLVLPRVLCQIINEACFALQEDVAAPRDVDTAMKLGVNYPLGPIEWADNIGFGTVYAVLAALENDLRDDRYRIAPLLKQMAQTGEWWKKPTTS